MSEMPLSLDFPISGAASSTQQFWGGLSYTGLLSPYLLRSFAQQGHSLDLNSLPLETNQRLRKSSYHVKDSALHMDGRSTKTG